MENQIIFNLMPSKLTSI